MSTFFVLFCYVSISPLPAEAVVEGVKVLLRQSCLTRCSHMDCSPPVDCSPPGSSVQGFSRQEHWSGLPFPSPGDLPSPGTELESPALQADSLPSEPPGLPNVTLCP